MKKNWMRMLSLFLCLVMFVSLLPVSAFADEGEEECEHEYIETVTEPTCTEQGYTTYTCSKCGYSYKENYVEASGHELEPVETVAPTCTEQGYTEYKCTVCSEVVKDSYVEASGHKLEPVETVAPTCTEQGYTEYKCTVCDEVVKDSYVDALGHTIEIIEGKAATEDSEGLTNGERCSVCGTVLVECEVLPKPISEEPEIVPEGESKEDPKDEAGKGEEIVLRGTNRSTYTASVAEGIENGSVLLSTDDEESASISVAVEVNMVIRVILVPEEGYVISTVSASGESGDAIEVTYNESGYTFIMPAENVAVSAVFVQSEIEEGIDGLVLSDYHQEVAKNVTAGDKLSISVMVTSDVDIAEVKAELWRHHNNPAGGWIVKEIPLEDQGNGIYSVEYEFTKTDLDGEYCVERIIAKDVNGKESVGGESDVFYFVVSGCTNDTEPPTVTYFSLEESGCEISADDTIHFTANVNDFHGVEVWYYGISGILYRSLSEDGSDKVPVHGVELSETGPGVFSGTFTFSDEIPLLNGYYFIELNPEDICGNIAEFIDYSQYVHFIGGVDDYTGPEIVSIKLLCDGQIITPEQTLRPGQSVNFEVGVTDNTGVDGVYVEFARYQNDGTIATLYYIPLITAGNDIFTGVWEFDTSKVDGVYGVYSVTAYDTVGNYTDIYDLDNVSITFTGGIEDNNSPQILTYSFPVSGLYVSNDDKIEFSAEVTDDTSIDSVKVEIFYRGPEGYYSEYWNSIFLTYDDDIYYGSYTFSEEDPDGLYCIEAIYATDCYGNNTYIYPNIYLRKNTEAINIVTLNANGGCFENTGTGLYSVYYSQGDWFYGGDHEPKLSGKAFIGWYTESGELICGPEESFQPSGDMTLYAGWADGYSVTLKANGGYFMWQEKTEYTLTVAQGSSIYAWQYAPENADPHKAFDGWYYDAACTRLACGRESYFRPTDDVTLYAKWSQGYKVTFDANSDQGGYFWEDTTVTSTTVIAGNSIYARYFDPHNTDPNMAFTGWYTESGELICGPDDDFRPAGDIVLYAGWTDGYIIKFVANGGYFWNGDTTMNATFVEGQEIYARQYEPYHTDVHKAFAGWYYDSKCTKIACDRDGYIYVESSTTLYAKWVAGRKVTFNANGGYFYDEPNAVVTSFVIPAGSAIQTVPYAGVIEGQVIAGWYLNSGCTGSPVDPWSYVPTKDITLYAKWSGYHTVTFDAGEDGYFWGDPETTSIVEEIGFGNGFYGYRYQAINIDEHKRFAGWLTEDGEFVDFEDYYIPDKDITLYAQWNDCYKIELHGNGGYFWDDPSASSISYYWIPDGTNANANWYVPVNTEFNKPFFGWFSEEECENLVCDANGGFLPEEYVNEDGNIVLYAGWLGYTVTLDANGGDFEEYGTEIRYNSINSDSFCGDWFAPGNTDSELEFTGWYFDAACTRFACGINDEIVLSGDVRLYARWSICCKITLYANGGYFGDDTSATEVIDITPKGELFLGVWYEYYELKHAEGLAFAGWYYDSECTLPACSREGSFTVTENVELYAKWTGAYTVSFDPNGGYFVIGEDNNPQTFDIVIARGEAVDFYEVPYVENPNHDYQGWFLTSDCSGDPVDESHFVPDDDVTLFAKWKEAYTVTLNANGGHFWGDVDEVECTVEIGKEFCGWWYAPEHDSPMFAFYGWNWFDEEGAIHVCPRDGCFIPTEDMTIYASWTDNAYTVKFNGNGADGGSMQDQIIASGIPTILRMNEYWREGYEFTKWTTKANGKGNKIVDGDEVTDIAKIGTAITLYAQWTANKYTVVFEGNGATSGTVKPESMTYGKTAALTTNAFKRDGYTFLGWSENPNTKAPGYADKQKVSNLTSDADGRVTLYAIWAKNSYNVVYNANGGSGAMANGFCEFNEKYEIQNCGFSREGFKFKEWNTKANGKGVSYEPEYIVSNLTTGNGKTVTLYAIWEAYTYNIKFHPGCAEGEYSGTTKAMPAVMSCGKTYTLSANGFKRNGYTFVGWEGSDGRLYSNKAKQANFCKGDGDDSLTLTAVWTPSEYKITYKNVVITDGNTNPVVYRITDETIVLEPVSRPGCEFKGWYTDSKFKNEITEIPSGSTGAKTLYAKWAGKAYNYKIVFEANGGTGTMKQQTMTCGAAKALTANAFKKTGYSFAGWADDEGNTYTNKQKVLNLTEEENGVVTLHAQWTAVKYKIVYKNVAAALGENPFNDEFYTIDQKFTLEDAVRPGYVFLGWYKDAKYKNRITEIQEGSTGSKTIYARFEPLYGKVTYTIAFDANGGAGKMKSLTKRVNGTVYTLTGNTFKREGFTFAGWNTAPDGSGTTYCNKAKVGDLTGFAGATVTLYAQWTPKEYKLTYKNAAVAIDAPSTYTAKDTFTLPKPEYDREKCTFIGWYTTSNFKAGTKVDTVGPGWTGNKVLYAKFQFIACS